MPDYLLLFCAYLMGSIPSAVLICRAMGLDDPRSKGSGNPGATNVLRTGGPQAAGLTLLADLGKGAAAVLLAINTGASALLQGWVMLAAVCGHLFPFFSLRGGKGVATTLGCSLLLSWPLALCQLLLWGLIFLFGRISSLASIATAAVTPLFCYLLTPALLWPFTITSLLLILRHSSNIRKLISGREHRF
ncbi:glycerol-3-phosphate 1-O-acyltransferase PlsY [Marinobacterium sediminicola]|uniref:Glycerol-3-phosphate acyltransferase n=1 Tax=Marinobacterium sediminicola TaxID=518898 RepID=A0ABY1RY43_9GAMM|nr:glycerol-3-phosphate 1-O-acyltransferase PlsY [Marinobacterium sediminicola]ULG68716.1 glycerol-3-phosphate 1-O-acyltransferase PlsY [Marinobacterium sediminicola]SMR73241.1 acyl-phosphate glycerol-3-phosphate acyltransferase [Marinobacterium sediminicola]